MFDAVVPNSILELTEAEWARVAPKNFPFLSYNFLRALEQTGCLGRRTGWEPHFITLRQNGVLQAASVWFTKTNSYGEYIFDFAWAQAFEAHGLKYYPKLVAAVPFTPATGPKLLLAPQAPAGTAAALIEAFERALLKTGEVSSAHALFLPESELPDFKAAGYMLRDSFQYHYVRDSGDHNFQDFLSHFKSKRRREIRREREQVVEQGLTLERLTGDQLTAEHATLMTEFYLDTVGKMGGFAYLTPGFFQDVFRTMNEQILFVLARDREGQAVAGALNYFAGDILFGRHWGCKRDYKALHFEVCYYQGIEFMLEKQLRLFEAGAQGEHKFNRGFLPRLTYSAHKILDSRFQQPIQDFLLAERQQLVELFDSYRAQSPLNVNEE
jgi:predicted N-acyltransferase